MVLVDIDFCAHLCRQSYANDLSAGFLEMGDLRFGVRQEGGVTYIAFRGSANRKNWRRNFKVLPLRVRVKEGLKFFSRSPRGYVAHRGFVGAFRELSKVLKVPDGPVVFTGHSLGGAIALLFAEAHRKPCVTFGCPRVYLRWSDGPDDLEHTRIVSGGDPVPLIPRYLYGHKHPEILLADDDPWIELGDHSIDLYIERLKRREEKEWLVYSQPSPA